MSGVEVVQSKATFDESRITWTEAKTDKGATYHIGRLEDHGTGGPAAASEAKGVGPGLSGGAGKACQVNWKVDDNVWKDTTQDVKDTVDITRYSLHKNSGWYSYILLITNTHEWAYRFYDETDDGYGLACYRRGDHFVKYNSDGPNIVHIQAAALN